MWPRIMICRALILFTVQILASASSWNRSRSRGIFPLSLSNIFSVHQGTKFSSWTALQNPMSCQHNKVNMNYLKTTPFHVVHFSWEWSLHFSHADHQLGQGRLAWHLLSRVRSVNLPHPMVMASLIYKRPSWKLDHPIPDQPQLYH